MTTNLLVKQAGGKAIFCIYDGKVYVADQDIDAADVSPEIEETVTGFAAEEDTIILVDSEDTNDFGCNYMWYAYCGFIDNVTVVVTGTETTGFVGSIPPRR